MIADSGNGTGDAGASGADAGSIGELLERKGVVDDARFFELNATLTLRRGKLRTGNYVLRRNMTPSEIV